MDGLQISQKLKCSEAKMDEDLQKKEKTKGRFVQ